MSDHNKPSLYSSWKDPYDRFLRYKEFDIMLKDINEEALKEIGAAEGIEHLSAGTFTTPAFPVKGVIYGPNSRFMVPLVFRLKRLSEDNFKAINVWCLLGTGSPFTCLTVKTLEAFFGAGNVSESLYYPMAIQDQNSCFDCEVSKVGTDFEHVNILGVNAMRCLKVSPIVNWDNNTFRLAKE